MEKMTTSKESQGAWPHHHLASGILTPAHEIVSYTFCHMMRQTQQNVGITQSMIEQKVMF